MKRLLLFGALLLAGGAQAQNNISFEEYDLDNGLHVILHEDHTTPIAAVTVLYHVGSKNENPERTGFAHFSNTFFLKVRRTLSEVSSTVTLLMQEEHSMRTLHRIEPFTTNCFLPIRWS